MTRILRPLQPKATEADVSQRAGDRHLVFHQEQLQLRPARLIGSSRGISYSEQISEQPSGERSSASTDMHTAPQHSESVAPTSQNRLTIEAWNAYRPTIIRIFRDEDRTLADVGQIMKTSYGFIASKKMYKTRLAS